MDCQIYLHRTQGGLFVSAGLETRMAVVEERCEVLVESPVVLLQVVLVLSLVRELLLHNLFVL